MTSSTRILAISSLLLASVACAAQVPKELHDAREAYRRASTGSAGTRAPAEVHVAQEALQTAERSFDDDPTSYRTKDLAYVAQRKSQMAEAIASINYERSSQDRSAENFAETQGDLVDSTRRDLEGARTELDASRSSEARTAAELSAEQTARKEAQARLTSAQAALARLAAVKEEPRGVVITLSGSVLFASGRSTLLPSARARLDEVSEVLMTTSERKLTVEGHTDSQGSNASNQSLSQRRADAVRDYILQRGYAADLVTARGMGEEQPVAENTTADGRANNRRVEIVIASDSEVGK